MYWDNGESNGSCYSRYWGLGFKVGKIAGTQYRPRNIMVLIDYEDPQNAIPKVVLILGNPRIACSHEPQPGSRLGKQPHHFCRGGR